MARSRAPRSILPDSDLLAESGTGSGWLPLHYTYHCLVTTPNKPGRTPDQRRTTPRKLTQQASAPQRIMAMLAWPLVLLLPTWIAFGHAMLAGVGGWMVFITMGMGLLALGAMTLHAVLVTIRARKVEPFAAGTASSLVTCLVVLIGALLPLFIEDSGDSGPVIPARVSQWFGASSDVAQTGMTILAVALLLAGLAMLVVDFIDLDRTITQWRKLNPDPRS